MVKYKEILFVIAFYFSPQINNVVAQREPNIWYFGEGAGLDFNSGGPIALTNGMIYTDEGTASISDPVGNLLFYTNGEKVYNKNHIQMPNGIGLYGSFTTTQTLIVRQPGSTRYYYIFTAAPQVRSAGLRYSKIDMKLDGGLGDVVISQKNIPLYVPTCEKIAGVQHCNNRDVWVVTHELNTNGFRTYLITSSGIDTVAVKSNAGIIIPGDIGSGRTAIGQLKASSDGKKLACASSFSINRFELFDFNNSTGIISNAIIFPALTPISVYGGAYGVEFSPDRTKLYCSIANNFYGKIYQIDLCAGSDSAIANSAVLIANVSEITGSLQLAPDKKIYVAKHKQQWLGVINNPNNFGIGCNYINNGFFLGGKMSSLGLPNYVSNYFKTPSPPFTDSSNCLNVSFTAPTLNVSNCIGSLNNITSVLWNFGDPNSGVNDTSSIINPTHVFSNGGIFNVTLILNYPCGSDTFIQSVPVSTNANLNLLITSSSTDCDTANGIANVNMGSGSPPYTFLWSDGQTTSMASGLNAGTYNVIVTDVNGCKQAATASVISKAGTANAGIDATINFGSSTQLNAAGGGTYSWSPSDGLSCTDCQSPFATPSQTTIYTVIVTDTNGCTATDDVKVKINCGELFVPTAFSPNGDGENDVCYVRGHCILSLDFSIFNRWGEKVFETAHQSYGWDGTYRGQSCSNGVYIYYLNGTLVDGSAISKKGNITLVK